MLLIKHGANLNVKYGRNKGTILHELADVPNLFPEKAWEERSQMRVESAELLIKYGADVNARDAAGNTPLHAAARANNLLMIKMFVSHGADLRATNVAGQTPLYSSIATGHWGQAIARELLTIGTLASLEANAAVKPDWAGLKGAANKAYNQIEKEQLLKLLDQLEKNPSSISKDKNLEKTIDKIIADTPKSQQDRLASCEPSVAISAAEEVINNPDTLKEPLLLFSPAAVLFLHGKKDEAVFWFYAAQLRVRYQLVFEKGDRGQLLTVMMMTVGAPINNYAFQDVTNFNRILDRVLEWDKNTPSPFRNKARTESSDKQIEQVYSGFRDLKAKLVAEKDDLEQKARLAARTMNAEFANRCRKPAQQSTPGDAP